jgi:hypothetical protein
MKILENKIRDFKINNLISEFNLGKNFHRKLKVLKDNNFSIYKSKKYSEEIKFTLLTVYYEANNKQLIFNNLNSLLSQELKDVEIIIITNGISIELLKKISEKIGVHPNITIVQAEVHQFDISVADLDSPLSAYWNLGLILGKGTLFTCISWDDEINSIYCKSIYRLWEEKKIKCFAPYVHLIDKDSRILIENTQKLTNSFSKMKNIVSSRDVMISKMNFDKSLFTIPGEVLVSEREHLINRGGYDYLFDYTQFFKISAGESIGIVKDSILKWRYHDNQGHKIERENGATYNKISQYIFKNENIYELHKSIYGYKWAERVKKYFLVSLQIKLGCNSIYQSLQYAPDKIWKVLFDIIRNVGFVISIKIFCSLFLRYMSDFFKVLLILFKNPSKIFKISKVFKIFKK